MAVTANPKLAVPAVLKIKYTGERIFDILLSDVYRAQKAQ